MIGTVILIVLLCLVGWQVYETIKAYGHATGSTWERLKSAFLESATIAWARINSVSAALIAALAWVSDWAGAPGIKDAVTPFLGPQYVLAYGLIIAIGAEVARRRSL